MFGMGYDRLGRRVCLRTLSTAERLHESPVVLQDMFPAVNSEEDDEVLERDVMAHENVLLRVQLMITRSGFR